MQNNENNKKRPFIGMLFKCCNVYVRLYLDKDKKGFSGNCPKCGKKAYVKISPYGEKTNFFTAE